MRGIAEAVYVGSSYGSGSLSLRIFATKLVMASVHGTLIKLLFLPRVSCEIHRARRTLPSACTLYWNSFELRFISSYFMHEMELRPCLAKIWCTLKDSNLVFTKHNLGTLYSQASVRNWRATSSISRLDDLNHPSRRFTAWNRTYNVAT